MFLEYTIDSKEEEIHPSSVELRKRFASRKARITDDKQLRKLREKVEEQKAFHGSDVLDVTLAEVASKTTLVRLDHHMKIERQMKTLDRDLARASRIGKTRLDTLNDLEKRIITMRQELAAPGVRSAKEQLELDKKTNNKMQLEEMFTICTKCNRKILKELLAKHTSACAMLNGRTNDIKPIYNPDQDLNTSITTFKPQPPRNCKLVKRGSTFLQFSWDPPIMAGGLSVYDYEIKYEENRVEYDAKAFREGGSKWKRSIVEHGPIQTSRWCMNQIVCHNGAKVDNLYAATDYSDFWIRSVNIRGVSEWSSMIGNEKVKTNEPDPPSQPLFFELETVTASCIHLKWCKPLYTGGAIIDDYIIHYTVVERHISASSRNVMINKDHKVNVMDPDKKGIDGAEHEFVIRNVASDTDVINISIKAENRAGLLSEANDMLFEGTLPDEYKRIEVVRTKEASRHKQLHEQIAIAKNSTDEFIDTDFVGNIQQRISRTDYMAYCTYELTKTTPHWQEEEEDHIWTKIKFKKSKRAEEEAAKIEARRKAEEDEFNSDDDDEDEANEFIFPYRFRRAHFKHKIASLERDIEMYAKEKHDIDSNRARTTNVLKKEQLRKLELQLEKDRVKNFNGDLITSSALHGSAMRYQIGEFVIKIQTAYEDCLATIASAKMSIINGENRKAKVKKLLNYSKNYLKDRIASFKAFNLEHEKAVKAMEKMQTSDIEIYKYYFRQMKENMEKQKNSKATVGSLFEKVRLNALRQSFIKWSTGEHEKNSNDKDAFDGVGSILLQKAKETRLEIQGLARAAMAEIPVMKTQVDMVHLATDQRKRLVNSTMYKGMEEGMDHVRLEKEGLHFVYEADALALTNKFEPAKNLYETQIWKLRSEFPVNIKLLAVCYGRLGKLWLRAERYDRAIVEFDRQLSLANEIDDKVEAADAYYGIGSGCLGRNSYDDAIRYLDIAQGRLAAIGSAAKYCGCLRALREVYSRLQKTNIVRVFDERIAMEESELDTKMAKLNRIYENWTNRLKQTSADIEFMVTMERCGKRVLDLRQYIDKLYEQRKDAEKEIAHMDAKIVMQLKLLEGVQNETDEAKNSEEPEMHSKYSADVPQVIEIEEARRRLPIRLKLETENLKKLHEDKHRYEVTVTNCDDQIAIEDENLSVENGVLAKHTRDDKPFRVVAFSPTNAAANEISGTATGGVENFACAEGHNVHMIDYHSGELIHIFIGDHKSSVGEKKGHTGVVTCLYYDGTAAIIFSGSTDETIIAWDTVELKKSHVFRGHEGTVLCMATDGPLMVSGSADNSVRIWDKYEGRSIRVLHGHSRSVLCLDFGTTWLLTGSADEDIRLWEVHQKTKHTITAHTKYRLEGMNAPITCVKYGKLEIVTADSLGRIFIWWAETGAILRQCHVHEGSIKSLQFDAIHIVSGGTDNSVCITDIATGEVLQTLRGHTNHVLAIAFDSDRIVSASGDNTLRYWQWGSQSTGPSDKVHVLDQTESLVAVAKRYDLTVPEMMKWNGITEMKDVYPGMKLIVQKGNPGEPTEAEAIVIEKEKRRQEMASFTERRLKKMDLGQAKKYDRIHRNAMDLDPHSLGNRMYAEDKKKRELFVDKIDVNRDNYNLAARLHPIDQSHLDGKAPRYFFSVANEDEWGQLADYLAQSMLDMLIEYESYDVVKEQKRMLRNTESVIGRIHKYEANGFSNNDIDEWQKGRDLTKLPLKLRRYFEMVNAAEQERKRKEEEKNERDRMNFYSRERQGAGLPSDPVVRMIKNEREMRKELEGDDEDASDLNSAFGSLSASGGAVSVVTLNSEERQARMLTVQRHEAHERKLAANRKREEEEADAKNQNQGGGLKLPKIEK